VSTREELADELFALFPALRRRFQAGLPEDLSSEICTVTPHQLEALHLLAHHDADRLAAGHTMNELARAQGCALSSATALVDRLIRQGLAERISDPEDRRVVRIAPTARGRELTRRFAEAKRRIAMTAFEALADDELRTLIRLLRKTAIATPVGVEEVRVHG
jgi:DNA-binding MarR family transcriptional regulator